MPEPSGAPVSATPPSPSPFPQNLSGGQKVRSATISPEPARVSTYTIEPSQRGSVGSVVSGTDGRDDRGFQRAATQNLGPMHLRTETMDVRDPHRRSSTIEDGTTSTDTRSRRQTAVSSVWNCYDTGDSDDDSRRHSLWSVNQSQGFDGTWSRGIGGTQSQSFDGAQSRSFDGTHSRSFDPTHSMPGDGFDGCGNRSRLGTEEGGNRRRATTANVTHDGEPRKRTETQASMQHQRHTVNLSGLAEKFTVNDVGRRATLAAEALGVRRDAGRSTVAGVYYKGARKLHPDKGGQKEDFQVLREAYAKLLSVAPQA